MNQAQFDGMTSSDTDEWYTPQNIFDQLSYEFGPFDLDPCANKENAKCIKFFTREENGLSKNWGGRVFMNPPYGQEIGEWVAKARQEAHLGAVVVCLLPARTDTSWWHENIQGIAEVRFVRGRIKFGGSENPAPFPSAIVIFRGVRQ